MDIEGIRAQLNTGIEAAMLARRQVESALSGIGDTMPTIRLVTKGATNPLVQDMFNEIAVVVAELEQAHIQLGMGTAQARDYRAQL